MLIPGIHPHHRAPEAKGLAQCDHNLFAAVAALRREHLCGRFENAGFFCRGARHNAGVIQQADQWQAEIAGDIDEVRGFFRRLPGNGACLLARLVGDYHAGYTADSAQRREHIAAVFGLQLKQ